MQKPLVFVDKSLQLGIRRLDSSYITLPHIPKRADIIALPCSDMLHLSIELDSSALKPLAHNAFYNANDISLALKDLLFAKAFDGQMLESSVYCHMVFFIRAHLFDWQKCVCECFFLNKLNAKALPKAKILTSDIFLPLALAPLVRADFAVVIDKMLCYFENGSLKELLALEHSALDSKLAYLNEAHSKHLERIYYFMPHISIDIATLVPLSAICEATEALDMQQFRAFLAFSYVDYSLESSLDSNALESSGAKSNALPNFARATHFSLPQRILAICAMVFIVLIPLVLGISNMLLERDIEALHSSNEALFSHNLEHFTLEGAKALATTQAKLLNNAKLLQDWQSGYNARYAFMRHIFLLLHQAPLKLESIDISFSQSHFVAHITLQAHSQVDISALLSHLNAYSTNAFLQSLAPLVDEGTKPSADSMGLAESAESSAFIAHIVVVHNAK